MEQYIDLHTHSLCSDGSFTPVELVKHAKELGLYAIALTDHDTTDGLDEALRTGKNLGVYVIPGLELSTEFQGEDVHILGLFIDYKQEAFQKALRTFQDSRKNRNLQMIENLRKGGYPISQSELTDIYGADAVLTRMHMAQLLFKKGCVPDVPTAFSTVLSSKGPYYVPRKKISPKEAVALIKSCGGSAVLAHPLLYHFSRQTLVRLLQDLKAEGLEGLECLYSTFTAEEEKEMLQTAKEIGLFFTGGSDFHGTSKPHIALGSGIGNLKIPATILNSFSQWPDYKKNFYSAIRETPT